jgi:hypothetical protein
MQNGDEIPRARWMTPRTAIVALAIVVVLCASGLTLLAQTAIGPWLFGATAPSSAATTTSAAVAATELPSATPTPTLPDERVAAAVQGLSNLRGRYLGLDSPYFADPIMAVLIEEASPPSLSDVQYDAFLVQRRLWESPSLLPSNWEVAVQFYINTVTQQNGPGTYVAQANLHGSTAAGFNWDQLTPQQAWQRYDGTVFNAQGS